MRRTTLLNPMGITPDRSEAPAGKGFFAQTAEARIGVVLRYHPNTVLLAPPPLHRLELRQ